MTVDVAVFGLRDDELRVLLIRRGREPFAGRWAFPGGFLDLDEPIAAAARRELREETGLEATGPLELFGVFGEPGRDPRGRTISLAHATATRGPLAEVVGGDDAAEAAWLPAKQVTGLAFDHDAMLTSAIAWLARRVAEGPVGLAMLPVAFEDGDVKALHRAVFGSARGALAWRRRLQRAGRIIAVEGARLRVAGP